MITPKPSTLSIKFSYKPLPDEKQSRLEGRRVTQEVEFVEIRIPGSQDVIRRPAVDKDREQYAAEYEAFKEGRRIPGTPVEALPDVSQEQAEEMHHVGIRTVEQLANVSDAYRGSVGNFLSMRRLARDWLAAKAEAAVEIEETRRQGDIDGLRAENESLKSKMVEMENRIQRLTQITGA